MIVRNSSLRIMKRILKLVLFFGIIFTVIFCITWQNIHMYLVKKRMEEIMMKRNALEKTIYLLNMELSYLKSRERITRIATEELKMEPINYRDIRYILY
jgi:cell division protein FtsL